MYGFRKLKREQFLEQFCGPVAIKFVLDTRIHLSTFIDYVRSIQVKDKVNYTDDILRVGTLDSTIDYIADLCDLSVIYEFDSNNVLGSLCNIKLREMSDQGYSYGLVKVACLDYNHVFAINNCNIRDVYDWREYEGSVLKIWASKNSPDCTKLISDVNERRKIDRRRSNK